MGQPDTISAQRRGEAIALVLLLTWAATVVARDWGMWGDDLSALYFAARFAAAGAWDIAYAAPEHIIGYGMTAEWEAESAALGYAGADLNRYVYPPLWAALLAPVAAQVDPIDFFNAMLLLHVSALVLSIWATWRMVPAGSLPAPLRTGVTLVLIETSVAGIFLLDLAQPQILVIALCLLALERAQAGRPLSAGSLLALAASIKVAPGLLVLAFVVCGMWAAVAAFAVVGVILLALSIALAGWPAHALFLEALDQLDGVIFLLAINPSAPSLLWLAEALWAGTDLSGRPPHEVIEKPRWIPPAILPLAISAIAASLWVVRRTPVPQRVWLAGGMLYLIMTLFSGFAWIHYMVLPLILLPGLAGYFPRPTALVLVGGLGAAQSLHFYEATLRFGAPGPQIFLGVGVLAALWALMAAVALRLRTKAEAHPAPAPQSAVRA